MDMESGTSKMYRVTAIQLNEGWQLSIPEAGEIWVRRLTESTTAARNFIADRVEAAPGLINIQMDIRLNDELEPEKKASVNAQLQSQKAQEHAARTYRSLARNLSNSGMSGAEIAMILGVSRQRVAQLLSAAEPS
ncbi:hypothetical protein ACIQUL_12865 [Streptomyces sp. NPDC090303]|uniref:hypothetical protein n=1 Tax=Streptomyces sp. NPDC090303 TaxID=3365960 RepID=UPI00381FFEE2